MDEKLGDCVLCVTGLFEEIQEEDLLDVFADFGAVKNLHLNLDKKTGYAKGYAFVEYGTREEAQSAIDKLSGTDIAGQQPFFSGIWVDSLAAQTYTVVVTDKIFWCTNTSAFSTNIFSGR